MNENKQKFWHRLHDRLIIGAQHKFAMIWLFVVAFLESSISPIPPDVMFVPMVLANPDKAWTIAFVSTVGSLAGGILGYFIGYSLFALIGEKIISLYGLQNAFAHFQADLEKWGFWIISLKGLTPIPFKIVTICSGIAHLKLSIFLTASLIARSFRFFILSSAIKFFGPSFSIYFKKYFSFFVISLIIMVIGSFAAIGYIY